MIYLASPFTHEHRWIREERVAKVAQLTMHLIMDFGMCVFSPVVYTAALPNAPVPFEPWQSLNDSMISRCDQFWIYRLHGWLDSRGIAHETALAQSLSKPISFVSYHEGRLSLVPEDHFK